MEDVEEHPAPTPLPLPVAVHPDPTNMRNHVLRSPTDLPLYCLPTVHFQPGSLHPPVVSPEAAHLTYDARARAVHWEVYRQEAARFSYQFPYDMRIFQIHHGVFADDPVFGGSWDHLPAPSGLDRPTYDWIEPREQTLPPPDHAPRSRRAGSDNEHRHGNPDSSVTPEQETPPPVPHGHWEKRDLFQQLPHPRRTSARVREAFYPRVGHHTSLLDPRDAARLWPAVVRERQESQQGDHAEFQTREAFWKARDDMIHQHFEALRQSVEDEIANQENE